MSFSIRVTGKGVFQRSVKQLFYVSLFWTSVVWNPSNDNRPPLTCEHSLIWRQNPLKIQWDLFVDKFTNTDYNTHSPRQRRRGGRERLQHNLGGNDIISGIRILFIVVKTKKENTHKRIWNDINPGIRILSQSALEKENTHKKDMNFL